MIAMARKSTASPRRTKRQERDITTEHAGDIEFVLVRKKVKNLNVRIRPDGEVYVSAPARMPISKIKEFVSSKSAWIARVRKEYSESPTYVAENATDEEKRQWKETVSAFAPVLVEKWEDILKVKSNKLVYRNMKSRWGSCQPSTGRICLNTRLALYPPECLEYVVVHELCHLLVRGHGKDFHELMTAVMPDWKTRRAKLR